MAINTVIFDFDGTVLDTNQVIIDSWQHTYEAITGKPGDEPEIIKTFGEPLILSMEKAFPGFNPDDAVEIYREYQHDKFEAMIELFPGMGELISELKNRGIKVGIVTSRFRRTTCQGLRKFGLDKVIDDLVTCEDTEKHKPEPEPALLALEHLGVSADEAVMVGDSMYDIKCAHNAGMKAVLVGWAMAVTDEDKSGPDRPEYIIEKAEELLDIVG